MTDLQRAIVEFESAPPDVEDETRLALELRRAADEHREVLRRSWEIVLNDRRLLATVPPCTSPA